MTDGRHENRKDQTWIIEIGKRARLTAPVGENRVKSLGIAESRRATVIRHQPFLQANPSEIAGDKVRYPVARVVGPQRPFLPVEQHRQRDTANGPCPAPNSSAQPCSSARARIVDSDLPAISAACVRLMHCTSECEPAIRSVTSHVGS